MMTQRDTETVQRHRVAPLLAALHGWHHRCRSSCKVWCNLSRAFGSCQPRCQMLSFQGKLRCGLMAIQTFQSTLYICRPDNHAVALCCGSPYKPAGPAA